MQGDKAAECFVPRPFLLLRFTLFSLNTHLLLPHLVMISRTLGPEVGGSIGLMFYLANVCGCAVSLLGLVEAVLDVFGAGLCSRRLCGFAGLGILGATCSVSLAFLSTSCVSRLLGSSERWSWPTGSLPSSWGSPGSHP